MRILSNPMISEVEAIRIINALAFKLEVCQKTPQGQRSLDQVEFLRYGPKTLMKIEGYLAEARRQNPERFSKPEVKMTEEAVYE